MPRTSGGENPMKLQHTTALLVLVALVLAAPALAQENETQASAQTEFDVRAGVTPASAFYGLTTAWERVQLTLTRDDERRAMRALDQADKRLAELEVLAERGQLDRAERAEQRFEELMQQATSAIERLEAAENVEQASDSLEKASRVRAELQTRLDHVLDVHERVLERQAERMDEQQLARLDRAFSRFNNASIHADIRLEESSERITTRARALGNFSDEQAEAFRANASTRAGLEAKLEARAERVLARMEERNQRLIEQTNNRSAVATERLEQVLSQQVDRLAQNFERANQRRAQAPNNRSLQLEANLRDRSDARAQASEQATTSRERAIAERETLRERAEQRAATARDRAAQADQPQPDRVPDVRRGDERVTDSGELRSDTRISISVDEDQALVRVQEADTRSSFTVQSTDREVIARAVAERLNFSLQEVISGAAWGFADGSAADWDAESNVSIRVTVGANASVAEVLVAGERERFVVESTSREQVTERLSSRLGWSAERVEQVTSWSADEQLDARVSAGAEVDSARVGAGAEVAVR